MKIKIDENLPNSLALLLQEQEHDVETEKGEGLRGTHSGIIVLRPRAKGPKGVSKILRRPF